MKTLGLEGALNELLLQSLNLWALVQQMQHSRPTAGLEAFLAAEVERTFCAHFYVVEVFPCLFLNGGRWSFRATNTSSQVTTEGMNALLWEFRRIVHLLA